MARRIRDDDLTWGIVQIGGLLLCLSLISPAVRQFLHSLFWIVMFVVAIGIILCLIVILVKRSKRQTDSYKYYDSNTIPPQTSKSNEERYRPIETTGDLIKRLRQIDWFQFEKMVELVYCKLGYIVTRRGGANPDGGIDLIIEKDGQTAAIQCKQWKTWNVGVKTVREFLGALTDSGIQTGIFITLNGYTGEAKQLAEKHGIEIINESGLAAMIEETEMKWSPDIREILSDTRKFCPKCESEMVLRTAAKGPNTGQEFWGCSTYPRCRFTMQI